MGDMEYSLVRLLPKWACWVAEEQAIAYKHVVCVTGASEFIQYFLSSSLWSLCTQPYQALPVPSPTGAGPCD